ncbi:antitoxin Xre-like helix-turn-helix domain-containing protein [Sphingopyxis sp. RIFCSPHIGHO2_12_FULL_65_19]|uniref:antitoxin Xre-like helix-turn-helix domain-containing protein n=1 Tax=Sphingopyxis sp. RIFCSPHIGHO2_12_FULL_65_19 TaxID=1802172 RepID=UPI0008C8C29F|nr:antitoxin Xre-like helix-turn-helix domain-containing protein [Sphingopyxis sp. RIFCSPHIGHO2_12_FULL_65_19]OHD09887.1 MAG: hypothetical protein A3E77_11610 [Sphingopyxis sp. RIFCSPHIGHO2_12_FULL_65_19]
MRKNDPAKEPPKATSRRRAAVNANNINTGWVLRAAGVTDGEIIHAPVHYGGGEGWDMLHGGPAQGVQCIGVGSGDAFLRGAVMKPLSAVDILGTGHSGMRPVIINSVDTDPLPPGPGTSDYVAALATFSEHFSAAGEAAERLMKGIKPPMALAAARTEHASTEKAKADLLAEVSAVVAAGDPQTHIRGAALALLGLDAAAIRTEEELIEAIAAGFPAQAIEALRAAGWPYAAMEAVIAPRRTLMRRKRDGQPLTPSESDAAWRLALVLVSAEPVFASREAAIAWLLRAKVGLRGRTPAELIASSVGTAQILSLLRRIDRGDYL